MVMEMERDLPGNGRGDSGEIQKARAHKVLWCVVRVTVGAFGPNGLVDRDNPRLDPAGRLNSEEFGRNVADNGERTGDGSGQNDAGSPWLWRVCPGNFEVGRDQEQEG
jgi:hypothetical protein